MDEKTSGCPSPESRSHPVYPVHPVRILFSLVCILFLSAPARAETNWAPRVRAVADFLLAQQTPQGCLPDEPGGNRANQDSGMERSLLALAHAYRLTSHERYRRGLREGIEWLAAEMEKQERPFVGSWRYAYAAKPPYVALPTSPGGGIEDARGLTATSALFVYLVALYTDAAKDSVVARETRPQIRAALEFLLDRNRAPNHLFYTAWHREMGTSRWALCRTQNAVDQADAYLGLRAGFWLLGNANYRKAADEIAEHAPRLLFDHKHRAFGLGLDADGKLIPPSESPEAYLVQGYLAWALPPCDETRDAIRWLRERHAPDHSIRRKAADPASTLSAVAFCLGAGRLALCTTDREQTLRWLRDGALTPQGGVRDVVAPNATVRNPLAGWLTTAWTGAQPLPFGLAARSADDR